MVNEIKKFIGEIDLHFEEDLINRIKFPLEKILTTTDVTAFCRSKGIDPTHYDQIGVHNIIDAIDTTAAAQEVTLLFMTRIPYNTEWVLGYHTDTVQTDKILKLKGYIRTEHGTALVKKFGP